MILPYWAELVGFKAAGGSVLYCSPLFSFLWFQRSFPVHSCTVSSPRDAGGRRCKRRTWTELLFFFLKKWYCSFKSHFQAVTQWTPTRPTAATPSKFLPPLFVQVNVIEPRVSGASPHERAPTAAPVVGHGGFIWIKRLAQWLLLSKILKQGRDNLFFIFRPAHRQSYIPHNNITKGSCKHVTLLHTHSHTVWPYIYLMRSSACVCVCFSYTPVSTAQLHYSVMNNDKNTSQLFKQSDRDVINLVWRQ